MTAAGNGRPAGTPANGQHAPAGGPGERATPQRGPGPAPGAMRHGPAAFTGGMPTEKSLDFRGSSGRLLRAMRPERPLALLALALTAVSVTLSVLGPLILGRATDLIFSGVIGSRLPAGVTKARAVARLRAQGNGTQAGLLSSLHLTPGQGVDFTRLGHVLVLVLAIYAAASAAMLLQGRVTTYITARLVFRMRADVASKLSRLPLRYFDRQPRGEILSRVTNDIDNLAQSLQQTLSQMVTSVLTIAGVLGMMLWISPLRW